MKIYFNTADYISKNNEWLLTTVEIGKIKFGKIIYLTIFQKTKKKKKRNDKRKEQPNKQMDDKFWMVKVVEGVVDSILLTFSHLHIFMFKFELFFF